MIPWDAIITFTIIAVAAWYVIKKFSKSKKGESGCGCSSEGSCCASAAGQTVHSGCQGPNHNRH